jgi:hypothetical protein
MTTTSPTAHDDDLMELVRRADPLARDPVAAESAESLLRAILAEPRTERSSSRHPGPRAVRLVAVAAVAAQPQPCCPTDGAAASHRPPSSATRSRPSPSRRARSCTST